jgi:SAM-dependent methyltransferase
MDRDPAKKMNTAQSELFFRQTRYTNESEGLTLLIDDGRGGWIPTKLKNWSRTGVGFEIAMQLGEFKENSTMRIQMNCGPITVFEGEMRVKSRRAIGESHFYGAAFSSGLFPTEAVEAAQAACECTDGVTKVTRLVSEVNPEFCRSVIALSAGLRHVREICRKEEHRWKGLTFDQRCAAEQAFLPAVVNGIKAVFMDFNVTIADQVDVEAIEEGSIYHQIFHEEVYPYFEGADLVRRAYEKPRGYAGDFEMMNQIYRNGYEGSDLFGKVLHNYISNENSGNSVRFRKPYFYAFYRDLLKSSGKKKALSIACGPAIEVQEIVDTWTQEELDQLHVTLFDLDREALEHAQTKIFDIAVRKGTNPNVAFVNASVKSFLSSSGSSGELYDLIYSGGLFDYLDNMTSAALTRKFASMLQPGGTLIIGNFTKNNLTKAFLHLLTSWTLLHKTEDEMRAWANGIEGCRVEIEFDPAKMNAFLVLRKDVKS